MACFSVTAIVALITTALRNKIPKEYNIKLLNTMLWGGVVMFSVEHMIKGEIVPYPPFFTAGLEEMLPEIISIGIPMTLTVIGVWAIIVFLPRAVPQVTGTKTE